MLNRKMMFKTILLAISFFALNCFSSSQETHIDQNKPVIQNNNKAHIVFRQFEPFKPDPNKVMMGSIDKIDFYKDNFYILDQRQSRIYVFDKRAKYLYSIGRPGQGPGDLEHPSDFFISDKGLIYVVMSMANRIEVFSVNGDFHKRILLSIPKEIFYAHPSDVLVDEKENIYVSYNLCSHLIDVYDSLGIFQKTLVERKGGINIPGLNIGNCSELSFFKKNNYIIHLDHFTGIFTKIDKTGGNAQTFSAFNSLAHKETMRFNEEVSQNNKESSSGILINDFQLWSNCCFDNDQNIYVFLLLKEKEKQQKMFVFSSEGKFLYWENITYFSNARVTRTYCFDDLFMFKTMDDDLFYVNKEAIN